MHSKIIEKMRRKFRDFSKYDKISAVNFLNTFELELRVGKLLIDPLIRKNILYPCLSYDLKFNPSINQIGFDKAYQNLKNILEKVLTKYIKVKEK